MSLLYASPLHSLGTPLSFHQSSQWLSSSFKYSCLRRCRGCKINTAPILTVTFSVVEIYNQSNNLDNVNNNESKDKDLLIIGAGDLGYLVGAEWKRRYPHAYVTAETRTERTHGRLISAGLHPKIYDFIDTENDNNNHNNNNNNNNIIRASNVIFCVPPPKIPNYVQLVRKALLTRRLSDSSRFIFVSSTAVYPTDLPVVNEYTPVTVDTERARTIFESEQIVLNESENGLVMRFSGLYSLRRGAHAFWAQRKIERVSERRTANMLHRSDAAIAVVNALDLESNINSNIHSNRTFLIASKESVSAKEMCLAMKLHPEYSNGHIPSLYPDDKEVRQCDSTISRELLNWSAQWESFTDFMRLDGERMRLGLESGRLID